MNAVTAGVLCPEVDLREDDLTDLALALNAIERIRRRHHDQARTRSLVGWWHGRQTARHVSAAARSLKLGMVRLVVNGAPR